MLLAPPFLPLSLTFNFLNRFRACKLWGPPKLNQQQQLLLWSCKNCPCGITLNLDTGVHNFSNKIRIPPRRAKRFMVCNNTLKKITALLTNAWINIIKIAHHELLKDRHSHRPRCLPPPPVRCFKTANHNPNRLITAFKSKIFPGFGGWFKDHAYSEEVAQTPDDVMHMANIRNVKFSGNSKILNFYLTPNNAYLLIISLLNYA